MHRGVLGVHPDAAREMPRTLRQKAQHGHFDMFFVSPRLSPELIQEAWVDNPLSKKASGRQ
jgi:hypothetical protein